MLDEQKLRAKKFEMYSQVPGILKEFQLAVIQRHCIWVGGYYCHIFVQGWLEAILEKHLEVDVIEKKQYLYYPLPPMFYIVKPLDEAIDSLVEILGKEIEVEGR